MQSYNPATQELIWEGEETSREQLSDMLSNARASFLSWSLREYSERLSILMRFKDLIESKKQVFAAMIAEETGKPLWECLQEVNAVIQKVQISDQAYQERCHAKSTPINDQTLQLSFKPHGVIAVFGPFNFPLHLPNGHIIPALLAGNCVLFKPSEKTPRVCQAYYECLLEAGVPEGVISLAQGGRGVGAAIAESSAIDGLFFTGSVETGMALSRQFAETPQRILALELGGNNPLLISSYEDLDAVCYLTIQSAFLTSGQRCSAARRLILVRNSWNAPFLNRLAEWTAKLRIGACTDHPEPFMGPLIDLNSANKVLNTYKEFVKNGAKIVHPMEQIHENKPFLTPGIIDTTGSKHFYDKECFGPLLQVIITNDFESGIQEANRTKFGLSAGLVSLDPYEWKVFKNLARAGVVNWNTPLTGASSLAPFGGIGLSGNHRPSAYFAADYSSYPMASLEVPRPSLPKTLSPGIER